jgi:protein-S-isoprenylcysteine O-methyltransferase Ste14
MSNNRKSGRNGVLTKSYSWIDVVPVTLTSALFISQIVVGVYLASEVAQIEILAYAGVGLYVFSGIVFGWLPVIEFRRKGGVKEGKSYIYTTKLVDSGIYSVVRHPQYVTFILFAISGMLLFQHWIVILLGVPIIPLTYIDLIKADKDAIEKFGDDYRAYVKKVPRMNFVLGIIRLLRRTKELEVDK